MHPLSMFPQLLTYGLVAPLLLRVGVGIFILYLGWERWNNVYKYTSIAYAIFGLLIVLGLYTQIASILGIIILKFDFYVDFYRHRKTAPVSIEKYFLYAFAVIILLSLIFTGPGFLAFDLPL